jgi:hypothetical protein
MSGTEDSVLGRGVLGAHAETLTSQYLQLEFEPERICGEQQNHGGEPYEGEDPDRSKQPNKTGARRSRAGEAPDGGYLHACCPVKREDS